jgi:dTDP-glucose pyrophosphorylase
MNLILTMAGRYSRFVNEGYRIPKYLLPWGNKPILSEILYELNKDGMFKNVFLIANKRDEIYMPHVKDILKSLNIPIENLFLISDTDGQAETAFQAIENIQNKFNEIEGPIVFHNIDTILYNRNFSNLHGLLISNDGYIDVFKSSNHNYSYVLIEDGKVQSIVEKMVISDKATSGLYGFSSVEVFYEFYSKDVLYISDLYQKMIKNGSKIVISEMHYEKDTIVLGTPSEYLTSAYILDL